MRNTGDNNRKETIYWMLCGASVDYSVMCNNSASFVIIGTKPC